MKKILGLDLGVTSIGWALVNEAETTNEKSSIIKLGVRVNPLSVDEQQNFEKGKSITTNAERTLKRSMRRNLQRYKLRRENLIEILTENKFISDDAILSENGNHTTFETYRLRTKAATEKISLEEFARVLLMINKKRGYKSSRKAKGSEDGALIDGMEIAKKLYDENLTPGQFCLQLLEAGKKYLPDFYRSDLQAEFDKVFDKQMSYYPNFLSRELKEELSGKKRDAVWAICAKVFKEKGFELVGTKRQGKATEQKKENYTWRVKGLFEKLDLEQLVVVLQQINIQLNNSSGYLGAISDRSKELYFNKQTVGQYQMAILDKNPNASLRNMVFYRQDYLDEFNVIWNEQTKHHKALSEELKKEIRDVIIFYQRPLKSQKGLISFCEFESKQIEVEIDGKKKIKTAGRRVIPRSSPLFQEFKIWQILNNIEVYGIGKKSRKNTKEKQIASETTVHERRLLFKEEKELLAKELSIKQKITKAEALKLLFENPMELDINFKEIQGNNTQAKLFEAYQKIVELSGHELNLKQSAEKILNDVSNIFKTLNYNTDILHFDTSKNLDVQKSYKLWHLLYSYEGDKSNTGIENLIVKLQNDFGFDREAAAILANVTFQEDYGSLSAKAISKILLFLKEGSQFDVACQYAGYRHSKSSLTKQELEKKVLKNHLGVLPKNSLRNPVVEKILNQMINVVNTIIDTYGKPDEIRVELARELKKNAKQREEFTKAISKATEDHEKIRSILQKEFGLMNVSRNDIIRYKLYQELKDNGYKTLYSDTYIEPSKLFSKEIDIEHIIPQSRLFDDSFSNKTLELRSINIEKGNKTSYDFVKDKYGETGTVNSLDKFLARIEDLHKNGVLSKTKFNKLKLSENEIPDGFINRDLGNTQYIAKYAKTILEDLVKFVISTTGAITDRLREDWQLVDVMKELNWEKYHALGLTQEFKNRDGKVVRRIKDWTKRNDHRHHAMDALTVAFTKRQYIQYLNNLNAKSDKGSEIYGIEQKELYRDVNSKLLFKPPFVIKEFRAEAKRHLENTLISIKAKNKVVTTNINKAKNNVTTKIITKDGEEKTIKGQVIKTPRGQLHDQTIYGSNTWSRIELSKKISKNVIDKICSYKLKEFLKEHIKQKGSIEKAFSDEELKKLQFNNKPLKDVDINVPCYTQRIDISKVFTDAQKTNSAKEKILKNVLDLQVREILQNRLNEFNGDFKKAFSNLDEKSIFNKNGKLIKRITIQGVSNAESLHDKRDKNGNFILDENGNKQGVDFVQTGNNHHVAVFRDMEGNLDEKVVSFYEAVTRRNAGLPIIDKVCRDKDGNPVEGWQFLFSMKQNEYFVFPNDKTGFDPKNIDLLNQENYYLISPNLFRVQTMSKVVYGNNIIRDYKFRHHLETTVKDTKELKDISFKQYKTLNFVDTVVKVRVNHIGQIVGVGEY